MLDNPPVPRVLRAEAGELAEARAQGWNLRRLLLEFEWLFWGLICGYGTGIGGAVAWAVFSDLLFAFIYWRWATVKRAPHPGAQQEYSFRLRLLDFPKQYSADAARLTRPSFASSSTPCA